MYPVLAAILLQPATSAPFTKNLLSGKAISIVAVGANQEVWAPDGGPAKRRPYFDFLRHGGDPSLAVECRHATLDPGPGLAVRVVPKGEVVRCHVRGPVWAFQSKSDKEIDPNYVGIGTIEPTSDSTVDLAVGHAAGKWNLQAVFKPGQVTTKSDMRGIQFGQLRKSIERSSAFEIEVTIPKNLDQSDFRVIAIDKNGKSISRLRGFSQKRTETHIFAGPISRVAKIQVDSRPYEWITFKGVRVQPR